MKLILLINVKMPAIVGILTFMSRINDWLCIFRPENFIDFGYFYIYEQLEFHALLSWAHEKSIMTLTASRKKFYNLGARFSRNKCHMKTAAELIIL